MAMSQYETIIWEEKMRKQIFSHARIVFADKITPTSTLDIISAKVRHGITMLYTSYLIMFGAQKTTEFEILLPSEKRFDVGISLQYLLEVMRKNLFPRMEMLAKEVDQETRAMMREHSNYA